MLQGSKVVCRASTPLFGQSKFQRGAAGAARDNMVGGVPRIYYGWMRPGSETRRRFEKMRNPFVDLNTGSSIYYRNMRDPVEAMRQEADAEGIRGSDNSIDLYNEHRIVPDLYPEGFQWQHKLNTEYNQWRSNTWMTPDLIPAEHQGRFLCDFMVNVLHYDMRVASFGPKDNRQWMYCFLYVGTGKGIAGYGQAVAPSAPEAKKQALVAAFQNIIAANLEDEGPIYPIRLNYEGCRVVFHPAAKLAANIILADVLCAFGFQKAGVRINMKIKQRPRNGSSRVIGLFRAVEMMKSSTELAYSRGKVPSALMHNAFPMMEEIRRRKGMFAQHPIGKDGVLTPNRVVDNRLPDHLKRNYYEDKYWKDFFAGASDRLNEPRIGMRSDELRALVPPTSEKPPAALLAASRTGGKRRRTLAEVLNRLGKNADALGATPIANPYEDVKLATHAKRLFHLH